MSFFSRSRKPKTSSSREKKTQTSGDGVKSTSGDQTGSSEIGESLFSGMTLTAGPATPAGNDLSLMGHSILMSTKQQSDATDRPQAIKQDFPSVLATSESELLPEPIRPIPVNIPQQVSQSTTKKKRTRHVMRPGYARQPDSKASDLCTQSQEEASEKPSDPIEQQKDVKQDVKNLEETAKPEDSASVPQTPLYSIGTPSSSEENLFQDVEIRLRTGSLTEAVGEGTLKDDLALHVDTQTKDHSDKELGGTVDAFKGEDLDVDSETTTLEKYFEVPMLQDTEEISDSLEFDKLSDVLANPPSPSLNLTLDDRSALPSCFAQDSGLEKEMADFQADLESTVDVDQNTEKEQQQPGDDVVSMIDMEKPGLNVNEKSALKMGEPNYSISISSEDKLSITLQQMKSQLATLSDGKSSLTSLEAELLKMYTEMESTENEKEQQVKALQFEESQALANDNYDLAEEINNRIEQLRADLETSRYRLPAQDHKVEKALKLRAEIAEKEAYIYRESQAALEQVRKEQQECLTSHKEIATTWSVKEKQRLNADRQRLERAKDHLKLDKEHMESEKSELSREILIQTEEFEDRKKELVQLRGNLQEEIVALEAKLTRLKEKEMELTESIKQEENKIESVKMTFSSEQNALDKQQQEIEAREKSLQEEFELLLLTQKQFDDKTTEHSTKEKELTRVLSTASDELDKSKQLIEVLERQQLFVKEFLGMKHFTLDTDSKLASLHAKQKEVSQQIKHLSSKIQLGQRGVATLRKSLNEIEAQISDLDASKEIAKQERNFKEAKRLKEEREALTQEGVESQEKLEYLLKELTEDKKLLEKAEQESNDLDTEINEQDRLAAMVTVEKASLVIHELHEQMNRISDDLIKALLETEVKTCKNLISDLCQKHNISMPDLEHTQDDIKEVAQETSENTVAPSEQKEPPECKSDKQQTKDCAELIDKLNELEGRLEAVVEVEDFDEADRLQQEITKLKEMVEQGTGHE